MRRLLLVVASLPWIVACHDLTDPNFPATATEGTPPAYYGAWWQMTEACYWSSTGNHIVLQPVSMGEGDAVRHEMLHALTRAGHSRKYFLERCAGVVACELQCVTEAGPAPSVPAGTPAFPPDSLDLGVELSTATPSISSNGGWFSVTVTAHNWQSRTVIADVSSGGDPLAPGLSTFGYDFKATSATVGVSEFFTWWRDSDPEAVIYLPGETKIQIFDFFITDSGDFKPGQYVVTGKLNFTKTASLVMTIPP